MTIFEYNLLHKFHKPWFILQESENILPKRIGDPDRRPGRRSLEYKNRNVYTLACNRQKTGDSSGRKLARDDPKVNN